MQTSQLLEMAMAWRRQRNVRQAGRGGGSGRQQQRRRQAAAALSTCTLTCGAQILDLPTLGSTCSCANQPQAMQRGAGCPAGQRMGSPPHLQRSRALRAAGRAWSSPDGSRAKCARCPPLSSAHHATWVPSVLSNALSSSWEGGEVGQAWSALRWARSPGSGAVAFGAASSTIASLREQSSALDASEMGGSNVFVECVASDPQVAPGDASYWLRSSAKPGPCWSTQMLSTQTELAAAANFYAHSHHSLCSSVQHSPVPLCRLLLCTTPLLLPPPLTRVTPPSWECHVGEHASCCRYPRPEDSMRYIQGCIGSMMLPSSCIGSVPAWGCGWSCLRPAGLVTSALMQGLRITATLYDAAHTLCRERRSGRCPAAHTAVRTAVGRGEASASAGGVEGARAVLLETICGGGGARYARIAFAVKGGSHTFLPACLSC